MKWHLSKVAKDYTMKEKMDNNYLKEIIVKSILSIFIYTSYLSNIKSGNPMKNDVLMFFRFNRLKTIVSSNR